MTTFSTRGLVLCALTALTVALGPAATGFTGAGFAAPKPARAAAATPTLSASPDSDLIDGQTITVTAAGYPINHSLDLAQCVQDQGCDFSNLMVLPSGPEGGYTTPFSVHRLLHLDGGVSVDCAVAENCILVSLDITDLSTGAQTSIGFDPSVPLPPPLKFRITPNANGTVNVAKGVARITGTVNCNQPVLIDVQMELEQIWHQQIFTSFTNFEIDCTRDGRFSAVFRPQTGLFGEGAAKVRLDAFGNTSSSYEQIRSAQVNLVSHSS